MPQMAPMNWLFLFFLFLCIFLIFNIMNFFVMIPSKSQSNKFFFYKTFSLNWKW